MSGPLWPVSIKGVLLRDGMALLLRNPRNEWELPGGRLEVGESPAQCVVREIEEECSLAVAVTKLLMVEPFEVISGRHVLIIAYGCAEDHHDSPNISHEHQGFSWIPVSQLEAELVPDIYIRAINIYHERQIQGASHGLARPDL